MASLTLKEIPNELMAQLRELADKEDRSLDQQVILLLKQSLMQQRPGFVQALAAFQESQGASPLEDRDFAGLRSPDPGRDVALS